MVPMTSETTGMKLTRTVVFVGGDARLLLSGVKRYEDGSIKSGDVENGAWFLKVIGDQFYALRHHNSASHVSVWAVPHHEEVPVKPEWRGDYNDIMRLAQKEFDETH